MENNNRLLIWLHDRWFIVLVLLFSLAIRLYKIESNLPNTYWHDENNYVETALRFGTGNFRPHTFQHGTAFSLALCAEYAVYFAAKTMVTKGYGLRDFVTEYAVDPTNFYLIGRITAALFGVGCILVIYLIAMRLYNKRTADIASLLSSLSLSLLIESRQVNTEPIAAFFLLLAFLTVIPIFKTSLAKEKKRIIRYYVLSAFFIGIAAAVKLYAVFGFSFLLAAHFLGFEYDKKSNAAICFIKCLFSVRLMVSALFLIIGFIILTPYILVEPHFFYESITQMRHEMTNSGGGIYWLVYLKEHIKNVVGSKWLAILIFISCIFSMIRPRKETALILAYPVIFYLFYMHYHGFAHYVIPAALFLLIITAVFLDTVFSGISKRRNYIFILPAVLIVIAPSFLNIVRYLEVMRLPDTRTIAREWIEKNIPTDSSILSEGYIKAVAVQVPQVKGNMETLERDLALVKSHKANGRIITAEMEYAKNDTWNKRYNIFKAYFLSADILQKTKADYVISSGYMADMNSGEREYLKDRDFYIKRKALYVELDKNYRLLERFSPYPEWGFAFPKFLVDDFRRLEGINILKDQSRLRQGPEIRIYCRKSMAPAHNIR